MSGRAGPLGLRDGPISGVPRGSLSAVSDRNKPPPGGASGSDNGVKEAGHRGKD